MSAAMPDGPFPPVATIAELDSLDHDEIVRGYMEFEPDDPPPGPNRGRAYWHGWRNAAIDHHLIPIDAASRQLAHELALRTPRVVRVLKRPRS